MRITNPFVVVRVTAEGEDLFQGVVAGLQGENRPPWAGWVLDGLRRTRVERDGNGALYWFRADGDLPNDLPRDPAPGITVYAPGDDAPTETDPATVRDAHLLLGVVLARFVRRLAEGREGEGAVLASTPATEPEPRAAAEPDPAPEAQRAEPAQARGGNPNFPGQERSRHQDRPRHPDGVILMWRRSTRCSSSSRRKASSRCELHHTWKEHKCREVIRA